MSPPATWVQYRVITTEQEVSGKDQYAGDLWGVYVALGNMDPKNLDSQLRDALAKSTPGEVMKPFFSPGGLELIMRCDSAAPA